MREKIIDDLAGMMGGAAGLISDIRDQVRGDMRDRMKMVAERIDLVTREEITRLEDRLSALEEMLNGAAKKTKAQAKAKPQASASKKKKAGK